MVSKSKILAVLFLAAMLQFILPAAALAGNGDYSAGDIAVINGIIENNGLNWTKWESGRYAPPADWTGVSWDAGTPKRITSLEVCGMGLTGSLNLSSLGALRYLSCYENQLTALDAGGLGSLKYLYCWSNQLASLNVSGLHGLIHLYCSSNNLENLDVQGLHALQNLHCWSNRLSALDVSGLSALKELLCGFNRLSSLELSGLAALKKLTCEYNRLSSLELSGLETLEYLHCHNNQLQSLDVSNLEALTDLSCSSNQLTSLDVRGLPALVRLDCFANRLASLEASGLAALEKLDCNWNQLAGLDVSGLAALANLSCGWNQLASLDVSGLAALESLSCENNQLTNLKLSGLHALTNLYCYDNRLASLDLSSLEALENLNCRDNRLTSLELRGRSLLKHLNCRDNKLSGCLDAGDLPLLLTLACNSNRLTGVILNSSAPYEYIDVRNNYLKDASAVTGKEIDWDAGSYYYFYYFSPQKTPADDLYLNKTEVALEVGAGETLIASHPGIEGFVAWTSDNPSVVTVSSTGRLTAKAPGRAAVRANIEGLTASCIVNVGGEPPPPLQSISLTADSISLLIDETTSLAVDFNPAGAANKRVTWTSSNPSVASVDAKGRVTGKSIGSAVITARSEQGGKTAGCAVTVVPLDQILAFDESSFTTNVSGPSLVFLRKVFTSFDLPIGTGFKLANRGRFYYDPAAKKYLVMVGDFKDFKNDDLQSTQEAFDNIKTLMAMLGKASSRDFYNKWHDLTKESSPLIVDGHKTVFGYLAFIMKNNQPVLTEGEIGILFEAGAAWKQPTTIPFTYLKYKVAGDAQGGLKLVLGEAGTIGGGIFPCGSLETAMGLSAAIGFDAFAADAYGGVEGKLDGKLNYPGKPFDPERDLQLKAKFNLFLEYNAFLIWGDKRTWTFASYQLYPPAREGMLLGNGPAGISAEDFKLLPRDYLGGREAGSRMMSADDGAAAAVIKTNVFPNSQTRLLDLDHGRLMLLWVDDAGAARSSANRTALFYSIYDGMHWSAPSIVEDDATADFAFDACVSGSKVFLAWQNAEVIFDDQASLEDTARNIELRVIEFDKQALTFGSSRVLASSDRGLGSLLSLCAGGDGRAALSWVSNSRHDFTGASGENSLYLSAFDGAGWGGADLIHTTAETILQISSIYDGSKHITAYSAVDSGLGGSPAGPAGPAGTAGPAKLYLISPGEAPLRLGNEDVSAARPCLVNNNGLIQLYWYAGNDIVMLPDLAAAAAAAASAAAADDDAAADAAATADAEDADDADADAAAADTGADAAAAADKPVLVLPAADAVRGFSAAGNAAGSVLFWENTAGLSTHINAVFYDRAAGKWSSPVVAAQGYGGRLVGSAGLYKDDGTLLLAYLAAEKKAAPGEGDDPFGFSDLLFEAVEPCSDLSIISGVMYDPGDVSAGGLLPISLDLQNNGFSLIEQCQVSIADAAGRELLNSVEAIGLGAGEICTLDIDCPLPAPLTRQTLTVSVLPRSGTVLPDKTLADNAVTFEVGLANLRLGTPRLSGSAGARELAVEIVNSGYAPGSPATLSLFNNETGEKLQEREMGSIPARTGAAGVFEIDIAHCGFTAESGDLILRVEMDCEDEAEINYLPAATLLLGNPYHGDIFEIAPLESNGISLFLTVSNNFLSEQSGLLLFQGGGGGGVGGDGGGGSGNGGGSGDSGGSGDGNGGDDGSGGNSSGGDSGDGSGGDSGDGSGDLLTHGREITLSALSRQTFEFDPAVFANNGQADLKIFITNSDDEVISNIQLASLTQHAALHHLNLISAAGGLKTFGASGSYAEGDLITIIADAAPDGKSFDRWLSSAEVNFADDFAETTTFSMPGYAVTVEAAYKEKGDECFIATAAYGSFLDGHVQVLRAFRDNVLLKHPGGRAFVAWYYRSSPPLAACIARHKTLRFFTRAALTPLVFLIEYRLYCNKALLALLASLALLAPAGFAVLLLRRRPGRKKA